MEKNRQIKCEDLMIGDWICDEYGYRFFVTLVGHDYAYADFDGNEGDIWEFDDKISPCYGIPLKDVIDEIKKVTDVSANYEYVHEFQHFLRLIGKKTEANNIKIINE